MPFCNACLDMYVKQAVELRVLLLVPTVKHAGQESWVSCDADIFKF